MSRVTMAGGDARNFDAGDLIRVTTIWTDPRPHRLWMWLTRNHLPSRPRPPSFREAWRGIIEERMRVEIADDYSIRVSGTGGR